MNAEAIRGLIAAGESLTVEFKGEEHGPVSDTDLVEAVVCLANRPEGARAFLLVGIEDDGRVTGARPRHGGGRTDALQLRALIANRTQPSLSCSVDVITVDDGRPVIAIEVPAARTPVGTQLGKYIRRAISGKGLPECRPFHFHEMQALQAHRGILDYSALPIPGLGWDALDPLEFDRFRRAIRESGGYGDRSLLELSNEELTKALGAAEANHQISAIRVLGLLLFGTEDAIRGFMPTHEAAFQAVSGTKVEVNDFFRWPVVRVMEEFMTRFRARNREEEIVEGLLRIGVPDYPERAFREALANALIHRDYARLGAVHVQWHDDRIEISSPGGFPESVTLKNLLVTPPRARNPLLADAFKRAGIVERTARGIDTIFEQQLKYGRPPPSYEASTEASVVVALPGGAANLAFARLVSTEDASGRPINLDELLLLNALWLEREITAAEATQLIQKPESQARATLHGLQERGLVEARGERKGRSFHLSAAVYRRLGQKAAYVRQRGFEPLQQEQMVLQYVQVHGRISRREVVDLCQVSSLRARAILARLVDKGALRLFGTKRGAYYGPTSKTLDLSKSNLDKSKTRSKPRPNARQ
jgi:ATP-dependent DNA helicase RecG